MCLVMEEHNTKYKVVQLKKLNLNMINFLDPSNNLQEIRGQRNMLNNLSAKSILLETQEDKPIYLTKNCKE